MLSDKTFMVTLVVSAIAHGVILFQNPGLKSLSKDKKEPVLEISYVQRPAEIQETKEHPILKKSSRITANKINPPPFVDRESIFKKSNESISQKHIFGKPAFTKPDVIAVKKRITLPPIDLDKINNPSYISYYQIVREKIRRAAYQNYTRTEVGEAYLSFLIFSDGSLNAVKLIDEKSSPSAYLKEIALRSIKEASPFPNFPKELDYPELSFNVVISFEIE